MMVAVFLVSVFLGGYIIMFIYNNIPEKIRKIEEKIFGKRKEKKDVISK